MSEAQAIETDIEIETGEPEAKPEGFTIEPDEVGITEETVVEEVEATKEEPASDGPIEIKVDGGEKPAPRRLSRTTKRVIKANDAAAEAVARAEAAEEQLKLYQLRDQQAQQSLPEPDEDTFEGTDAEFKAAQRAFNQQEIKRIAAEEAKSLVQQTIQQTTQASAEGEQDSVIDAHYERAEAMPVTNYHELEGSAADVMGDDFIKALILASDDSHRVIASLGASPREAAKIAELAKTNPTKAFANALTFKIHPSLAAASRNALDPEEPVNNGRGIIQPKDEGPPGATYS